jgi:hypothetical protein
LLEFQDRPGCFLLCQDGRQGTLLMSPAVRLFLAALKGEVDAVAANFVLVIVPRGIVPIWVA